MIQITLLTIVSSVLALSFISSANAEQIEETEVIICVNKSDGIEDNGLICHLYDTDQVDWYQDAYDGTFFKCGDCFDMVTVD